MHSSESIIHLASVLRGKQSGRVAARMSTDSRYAGLNCDLGKSRVGNLFLTWLKPATPRAGQSCALCPVVTLGSCLQ